MKLSGLLRISLWIGNDANESALFIYFLGKNTYALKNNKLFACNRMNLFYQKLNFLVQRQFKAVIFVRARKAKLGSHD